MKTALVWFCRIFVGLLFIFSGLIKANDPLGFSYKLIEYFEVFHINFLDNFAVAIAMILCALEIILGFALLVGARAKATLWGLLALIIFFAFLTFYSAYFEVVRSCGCFGDAIPLTPWQSFFKDLVLLLLTLVVFFNRDRVKPVFTKKGSDIAVGVATVLAFGVGIYTYSFLPVLDFLPYKVGANIPESMKIPPGAQPDEYEQTYNLKNKATGEKKVMNDKAYLSSGIWKDDNWEVVGDAESKLIKKGFTPKIVDLAIADMQGNDYTQELLTNPFYNLMIVAYDLKKTDETAIDKINVLALNLAQNYNTRVVLLTSNSAADAMNFSKKHKLYGEVFFADAVPLKSMVRANPGVLLLKDGVVIDKWHHNNMPGYDELVEKYFDRDAVRGGGNQRVK
ncbi:DoxX family protein [Mucilaginibacter hurinus]|uniref:DoxX family protein n=1 Tax=Mucilaginibacter hurinus TaxID=2201324 RepID=A0A367GM63_9SPHI|nr:BT_3928 family protein [Mucilaginibacter hurinus]RCH53783.1 DoxX family protein [Mucilaginibacter hurinus]